MVDLVFKRENKNEDTKCIKVYWRQYNKLYYLTSTKEFTSMADEILFCVLFKYKTSPPSCQLTGNAIGLSINNIKDILINLEELEKEWLQ